MDRDLLEKNYKKVNDQLFYIGCRKSKLKKEIYCLYDLYLKIIRSKLQNYSIEAFKALIDISSNEICVKNQQTILFIKNDLKNLVNKVLPFLTIEQLSIKNKYKSDNKIKENKEFKCNYYLKEEVNNIKKFGTAHTYNSMSYCSVYYQNLIDNDKYIDINIDDFIFKYKSFDYQRSDDSLEFINSIILLNDKDEANLSVNINQSQNIQYFIPNEFKEIIMWLDTLESSLNSYLKYLSIEINNHLLKKNILKRSINDDLLLNIFENHLLFSNPAPFILKFDPSLNQYVNFDEIYSEEKFSKINLINIDSSELEFININLSMLKNKILKLKSNIYVLIKKENYWTNKLKLNSNIKSVMNKL